MSKNSNILLILFCVMCLPASLLGQYKKPKLVVGIMVDQMRYDYLDRFWYNFGDAGFKRMVDNGFICRNGHYNYASTATGPGHASVYTGTMPAHHGIVNNNFYDRALGKTVYCVADDSVRSIGVENSSGKRSPFRLQVSTISDEMKLASNLKSKIISVSLKDRSAILPAGHHPDGAYWVDDATGKWVSSSYYMSELPDWVVEVNNKKMADKYLKSTWETLKPIEDYKASIEDNNPYEGKFFGEKEPVFPHNLKKIANSQRMGGNKYGIVKGTPFGNILVKDMAKVAIEKEGLGQDDFTDVLAISFSSTDYVGHKYGPTAIELEDTYLRLDKDLEDLFAYLDSKVGMENVLVFLTADHAAAHVPAYLETLNIPSGYVNNKSVTNKLKSFLSQKYGEGDWVSANHSGQIYLNRALIQEKKLTLKEVQEEAALFMIQLSEVKDALTGYQLWNNEYTKGYRNLVQNTFNHLNSPDVYAVWHANYMTYKKTGTTHGSTHPYDTHVPIIFYGWKVKAGETFKRHSITEIAPTISGLLHIMEPSGCYSDPIPLPLKE